MQFRASPRSPAPNSLNLWAPCTRFWLCSTRSSYYEFRWCVDKDSNS